MPTRSSRRPAGLLLAIASRETNCRNIVGDGGLGRGVFQIDDAAHADFLAANAGPDGIPPIPAAADYAAGIAAPGPRGSEETEARRGPGDQVRRRGLQRRRGRRDEGLKETGDPDAGTTNRNYGDDVLTRLHLIQSWLGGAPAPAPAALLPLLLPGAKARRRRDEAGLREWYAAHPPTMPFNDGPVYGPDAVEAVKEFQRRNKLLDDGKVGKDTWAALRGEAKTAVAPARQVPPAPAQVSFPTRSTRGRTRGTACSRGSSRR